MVAMFGGALVGALTVVHLAEPLALLIAVVLLAPAAVVAERLSRSGPVWDRPST